MLLFAVLSGRYWVFVEEVSLAGMPKPSLQGCIDGVFCNKYPVTTTDRKLLSSYVGSGIKIQLKYHLKNVYP